MDNSDLVKILLELQGDIQGIKGVLNERCRDRGCELEALRSEVNELNKLKNRGLGVFGAIWVAISLVSILIGSAVTEWVKKVL